MCFQAEVGHESLKYCYVVELIEELQTSLLLPSVSGIMLVFLSQTGCLLLFSRFESYFTSIGGAL